MSAVPELGLPPELAVMDGVPFTDDDLDRWGAAITSTAAELGADLGYTAHVLMDGEADTAWLPEGVRGYQITEDDHAEWALRQLAMEQESIARLQVQADEWKARIQHWFDQESRRHAGRAAALEERLEDYGLRRRAATGAATLTLPAGKIATTHTDPKAAVLDEDAVAAWAEAIPDAVIAEKLGAGDQPGERDQLVVRRPKVYVAAFRKLVTVHQAMVGVQVITRLECGHTLTTGLMAADAATAMALSDAADTGELKVACPACPPDPIEGDVVQGIVERLTEPVYELQVLDLGGNTVPGATVEPAKTTAKVTARG